MLEFLGTLGSVCVFGHLHLWKPFWHSHRRQLWKCQILQGSLLCPGSIIFLPWLLLFAISEQILPLLPFYLPHLWRWGVEQLQKAGWRALPMPSVLPAFGRCCYSYTEGSMTPWGVFNWRQHLPKVTFCSVISQWQTCWQLLHAVIRRRVMWNADISAPYSHLDAGFHIMCHWFCKFCILS